MDWNILFGILAGLFGSLNIFQVFTFRAYKKTHQAVAEKEQAEADEKKQEALERRLEAMENLYTKQGEEIDKLRERVLTLSTEKFENERRIIQLEGENKTLKEKVDWLEKEQEAYKTLFERGSMEHKF